MGMPKTRWILWAAGGACAGISVGVMLVMFVLRGEPNSDLPMFPCNSLTEDCLLIDDDIGLPVEDEGPLTGSADLTGTEESDVFYFEEDTGTIIFTSSSERQFATAELCGGDDCQEMGFWCQKDERCVVSLSDMDGRERGAVVVRPESDE